MNPKDRLVSVIMPAFNACPYIEEAICSVLEQSYSNWELLVIDDGSTDDTAKVLQKFNHPAIRVFSLPENKGVSHARNTGLKNCRGQYVAFLDADDRFPEHSLGERVEIIESESDISFVDGKVVTLDPKMEEILDSWVPSFKGHPLVELVNLTGSCFWGPSWLIRRKDIKHYFETQLTHGEDLWFYMQMAKSPELLYSYTEKEVLFHRKGHPSAMSDLKGLEKGYSKINQLINHDPKIDRAAGVRFSRISKSMVLKSYLRKLKIISVLRILLSDW